MRGNAELIISAYLRASTRRHEANRAGEQLKAFTSSRDSNITTFYVENESGTTAGRPELHSLISEAQRNEVLLSETIDRLSRHERGDWKRLRAQIDNAGLRIVAANLPITWTALKPNEDNAMMAWMQSAMINMLLDVMAAFARKDYEPLDM
ncbi:recombinase family protein [Pseudomonas benzopyrenica]|uniref:recombinase family protein n=1 Tax=Pseudomonas benzopyrenica TaxID=2993566 RepID=UPI0039C15B5C